jgi:hypothetical protein
MLDESVKSIGTLRAFLDRVIGEAATLSESAWTTTAGSLADQEATLLATNVCSDGVQVWGDVPTQVLWKISQLLYAAVLEHSRATVRLMVPPFRGWAPRVQVRSSLEASSTTAWLLDTKLSGRERIGRLYILRLKSSMYLRAAHQAAGAPNRLDDYGKSPDTIKNEAAFLGLSTIPRKSGEIVEYEGQTLAKYSERVKLLLGDELPYSIVSGSSHAEVWALLAGAQGNMPSPSGFTDAQHESHVDDLMAVGALCLYAVIGPLARAFYLVDDSGPGAQRIDELAAEIDDWFGLGDSTADEPRETA